MTTDSPMTGRVRASLGSAAGKGVVRVEDRFDTDPEDLWSALTGVDRLARWLGQFEGDLRLGGQFHAVFLASGWEGTGTIEVCDRPRRLLLRTWDVDGSGEHEIEATLTVQGEQTVLAIEERGMPLDQLSAYGAGVQIHLEDFGAHLAGLGRCEPAVRWRALLPSFEALAAEIT